MAEEALLVRWMPKAPAEAIRYGFDFGDRIAAGVTLASPTFAVSPVSGTLTASAAVVTGEWSTALISGGALGESYEITGTVVTSDGQTLQQTATLEIRKR